MEAKCRDLLDTRSRIVALTQVDYLVPLGFLEALIGVEPRGNDVIPQLAPFLVKDEQQASRETFAEVISLPYRGRIVR